MTITVRRATVADHAAIAAVHVASWEGAYRGLVPDAWFAKRTLDTRTAMWRAILDGPGGSLVHVAEDDAGAVIGFVDCAVPSRDDDADEDTAEIASFYVDPAHWRSGAGRALMTAAVDALAVRGLETATLWVLEDNPRAHAFYEASGWAADGSRRGDPPEIRLRRKLA